MAFYARIFEGRYSYISQIYNYYDTHDFQRYAFKIKESKIYIFVDINLSNK